MVLNELISRAYREDQSLRASRARGVDFNQSGNDSEPRVDRGHMAIRLSTAWCIISKLLSSDIRHSL